MWLHLATDRHVQRVDSGAENSHGHLELFPRKQWKARCYAFRACRLSRERRECSLGCRLVQPDRLEPDLVVELPDAATRQRGKAGGSGVVLAQQNPAVDR